jgi:hypothetical protein
VILKIVPEAGYCVDIGESRPIAEKQDENRPMAVKNSLERNFDLGFGIKDRCSKYFQRREHKKYINFSL